MRTRDRIMSVVAVSILVLVWFLMLACAAWAASLQP